MQAKKQLQVLFFSALNYAEVSRYTYLISLEKGSS